MTQASKDFKRLLDRSGSVVRYRRVDSLIDCPCLTPEGNRDPEWHAAHPLAEVCNSEGKLADPAHTVDMEIKGFVQPIQTQTLRARGRVDRVLEQFGDIQIGDQVGILPCEWNGVEINFRGWGRSGEDFLEYAGLRYTSVAPNLVADPYDGNPRHHWEIGLRLINSDEV